MTMTLNHKPTFLTLTFLALTFLTLTFLALTFLALTFLTLTFLALTFLSLTFLTLTFLALTFLALTFLALTSQMPTSPTPTCEVRILAEQNFEKSKWIKRLENMQPSMTSSDWELFAAKADWKCCVRLLREESQDSAVYISNRFSVVARVKYILIRELSCDSVATEIRCV
jgi:hypothetical protein